MLVKGGLKQHVLLGVRGAVLALVVRQSNTSLSGFGGRGSGFWVCVCEREREEREGGIEREKERVCVRVREGGGRLRAEDCVSGISGFRVDGLGLKY